MKKLLYILTIVMLLTSCGNDREEHNEDIIDESSHLADSGSPEPQFAANLDEKNIISINDTLYASDTLKIKFKTPHPKDLAIKTPDDQVFFIVYAGNDTEKPSLVDWVAFGNLDYLEIITDKTKANPWDAREHENKYIFTTTGQYEIRLSTNLESDDSAPVEVETVYYFDKKKP